MHFLSTFNKFSNEQLKFFYGTSSCFVIIILLFLLFCCKITYYILAANGAQPRSIHDSLLPRFDFGSNCAHLFQGALRELLYCKIGIQNTLNCVFMIDEQRR